MKHDQQNTGKNTDLFWMVKTIIFTAIGAIAIGMLIVAILPAKFYTLQAIQHDGANCVYVYTCDQDTFKWPDRCDLPTKIGDTLVYDIQQTIGR